MVRIEGGCDSCGRLTSVDIEVNQSNNYKLICRNCYDRYYSPEAIRDKKLNGVLKKSIWQKMEVIKNLILRK